MIRTTLVIILITICYADLTHAEINGYDPVLFEENGFEHVLGRVPSAMHPTLRGKLPIICLLIPDSDNEKICMFDLHSGDYIGDFIFDDTSTVPQYDFQTPLNAIQGPSPELNIYVSDQISDAVYVFDSAYGTYQYTYADTSDGLTNIRGIAFRDDHLFISCGDYCVMEFDGPHSFLRYFIQDGSNPFDIYFLDDDRALLSDIQGTADNMRLYDTNGTFIQELFSASTPEQIQEDALHPDTFYNCSFAENLIRSFLADGTILTTISFSAPRGVYRLGNGNLLATNGNGAFEIDPTNGNIIEQKYTYSARFIEMANLTMGVDDRSNYLGQSSLAVEPNPFRHRIFIKFQLARAASVDVSIYSILGVKIAGLTGGWLAAGYHVCSWDGVDYHGRPVNAGVYFIRAIISSQQTLTKKILYMK